MGEVVVPATAEEKALGKMKAIHTARLTPCPFHRYGYIDRLGARLLLGRSLLNCTQGTRPTVQRGDFSSTSEGRTEFSDGRCHLLL